MKPFVTDKIETGLSQDQALEILKKNAHAAGYLYRTRKMKDGSLKVFLQRKGFKTQDSELKVGCAK